MYLTGLAKVSGRDRRDVTIFLRFVTSACFRSTWPCWRTFWKRKTMPSCSSTRTTTRTLTPSWRSWNRLESSFAIGGEGSMVGRQMMMTSTKAFVKKAIPGLFFVYFRLFKQKLKCLQQIIVKNINPVYGAVI